MLRPYTIYSRGIDGSGSNTPRKAISNQVFLPLLVLDCKVKFLKTEGPAF
jgi:hypothetical protein